MTSDPNLVGQHTAQCQDFQLHKFADHQVRYSFDAVHPSLRHIQAIASSFELPQQLEVVLLNVLIKVCIEEYKRFMVKEIFYYKYENHH